MRGPASVGYYCSRPKRLKSGQYRLLVEHQLESPATIELQSWHAVSRLLPMLSVMFNGKRAVQGQVKACQITRINRKHWIVKFALIGQVVSRVCKGAAKSTASNQS